MTRTKIAVLPILAAVLLATHFAAADEAAESAILNALKAEKRLQTIQVQTLQENIRTLTKQVTMFGEGESLGRDVLLAESQLVALQAKHRAVGERLANPSVIPKEVFIAMSPELAALNAEKETLQKKKSDLIQTFGDKNDTLVAMITRQIGSVDEKIAKFLSGADGISIHGMQNQLRIQDLMTRYTLEQEIRSQTILVEELRKKYQEQLERSTRRAEMMLEISFQQTQLHRADKVLDAIDERIIHISVEQRKTVKPGEKKKEDLSQEALLLRIVEALERIESLLR